MTCLDFTKIGGFLHSHATYEQCCVMNLASDVRSFDSIVITDCVVSCTDKFMSSEFMKVVSSLPGNVNGKTVYGDPILLEKLRCDCESGAEVRIR